MLKIEKITDKEELDVKGQHPNSLCEIAYGNAYYGCLFDCADGGPHTSTAL